LSFNKKHHTLFTTPSFSKRKTLKIDFNKKVENLKTCPDENLSLDKFLKVSKPVKKKKEKTNKEARKNSFKKKCATLLSKDK